MEENQQLTIYGPLLQIVFRNIAACFEQEFSSAIPFLSQGSRNTDELVPLDVVKHDNIGTCVDGFIRLCLRAHLDIEE